MRQSPLRGDRRGESLRVVNRIEATLRETESKIHADIQQLAVQLAGIKRSIAEMVEAEREPELSPEEHRERYGSCGTCHGDVRLCESYYQSR